MSLALALLAFHNYKASLNPSCKSPYTGSGQKIQDEEPSWITKILEWLGQLFSRCFKRSHTPPLSSYIAAPAAEPIADRKIDSVFKEKIIQAKNDLLSKIRALKIVDTSKEPLRQQMLTDLQNEWILNDIWMRIENPYFIEQDILILLNNICIYGSIYPSYYLSQEALNTKINIFTSACPDHYFIRHPPEPTPPPKLSIDKVSEFDATAPLEQSTVCNQKLLQLIAFISAVKTQFRAGIDELEIDAEVKTEMLKNLREIKYQDIATALNTDIKPEKQEEKLRDILTNICLYGSLERPEGARVDSEKLAILSKTFIPSALPAYPLPSPLEPTHQPAAEELEFDTVTLLVPPPEHTSPAIQEKTSRAPVEMSEDLISYCIIDNTKLYLAKTIKDKISSPEKIDLRDQIIAHINETPNEIILSELKINNTPVTVESISNILINSFFPLKDDKDFLYNILGFKAPDLRSHEMSLTFNQGWLD